MRFDKFVKPYRADKQDIQFDRGMRLVAGGPQRRHPHGLIGERHKHAAMHDVGEIQVLGLDQEAEAGIAISPNRSGEVAKARLIDDFPPRLRRIEYGRVVSCRLVVRAGTFAPDVRAASRRLRSGIIFSALAPSAMAWPVSPKLRTALT